jgi:hypothetical protein
MEVERLQLLFREAARVAGAVASYSDRVEHIEPSSADSIGGAAGRLREVAAFFAHDLQVDLVESYAHRLEWVESLSPYEPFLPSPASRVRRATTWRDLQLAQLSHDRHYHPDVFGLPKREQLVHVSLHLTKIVASVALLFDADTGGWNDFARRRLPDMLLFGVKLSTLVGEKLDGAVDLTWGRSLAAL